MSNVVESSSSSSNGGSASEPPPKKRRERRPLDMSKLKTADYDPDSDEEYYCPEGVKKMDHEVWDKYLQQIEESEGFDITDFPGVCCMTSIVPLNLERSNTQTQTLIELATLAIQEYNKQHHRTKYEFFNVEKANSRVCSGIMYYITFQAKEQIRRDPAVKTFQARVWQKIPMSEKHVEFCRLKKKPANFEEKVDS